MALTNIEVEQLARIMKLKNFRGVFLQEDLKTIKNKAQNNSSYIINYGTEANGGTHYILIYFHNDNTVFHFDSFGAIYSNDVADFIKEIQYKAYNQFIVQHLDSSLCGWYCLGLIKYVQLHESNKTTFFENCNNYINLFQSDTTKNGKTLRQLFHHWLPKKQTPKFLFDILAKP